MSKATGDTEMDYGKAFRVIRAAFGLSQAELSELLSVGASHLSLIESGKRNPSHATLGELSRALRVPRALIDLLASTPDDVRIQHPEYLEVLAKSLLQLLVEASSQSAQRKLRL